MFQGDIFFLNNDEFPFKSKKAVTFCPVTNLQSFNWFEVSKHSCTLPIYIAASKSNQSIFCYFKFLILSATPLGKIIEIATPSFLSNFIFKF